MNPETQLQLAVMKWWALAHRGLRVPEALLLHIPNGGRRGKREAAILKGMGVRAGVPDLLLAQREVGGGCLWIELKAGAKGKLSAAQQTMAEALYAAGHRVTVCRTFEEAVAEITHHLTKYVDRRTAP